LCRFHVILAFAQNVDGKHSRLSAILKGHHVIWTRANRFDSDCLPLADRHYNRRKVGSPQFVPPGRCLVLKAPGAVWVTSWPFAEFVRHAWPGAFVNSLFRKECDGLASDYIRDACAATRAEWSDIPTSGMITFIDPNEVTARKVRGRLCIGYAYFEAGFVHIGYTKAGLWAMQLTPDRFPLPVAANLAQPALEFTA